jgi:hypothetical protein
MGKLKICIFFVGIIFCFSFLGVGFSETVTLKTGQKVEGRILERTNKYVKLEFQGVQLVYYNDEIASIDQASSDNAFAGAAQIESLYKAYQATLNPPQQPKEEPKEEPNEEIVAPTTKQEPIKTNQDSSTSQATPVIMPTPDLSQLPPEYQKLIKSTLANLKTPTPKPVEETNN